MRARGTKRKRIETNRQAGVKDETDRLMFRQGTSRKKEKIYKKEGERERERRREKEDEF